MKNPSNQKGKEFKQVDKKVNADIYSNKQSINEARSHMDYDVIKYSYAYTSMNLKH